MTGLPPTHPAMRWPLSVPVLTDGEVTLRAGTPDDLDAVVELCRDPDMVRWTAVPTPYERAHAEQHLLEAVPKAWDAGTARGWAIEVDGRFAGNLDVRGTGVADIGFALHPAFRGRGVVAAAVRLAVDWTFSEGVAEVVHWRAHVGNVASLRIAHAVGFGLVGLQPGLLWERGRAIDAWTASIRFGDAPVPRTRWLDDVVETDRLRLRPLVESDVPRLVEAAADPLTRQYIAGLPDPYTPQSARDFVHATQWEAARGTQASWALADATTDELLGHLALMRLGPPDPGQGEVGYWLHPAARGRGLMREALDAVVEHALSPEGLGLRRLSLWAAVGNEASNAVARACGFTATGRESAAEALADGTVDDAIGYERLR
ncbi:MAG: GNAT family N-acetyltransferase [Aeromicrobium erythreum]